MDILLHKGKQLCFSLWNEGQDFTEKEQGGGLPLNRRENISASNIFIRINLLNYFIVKRILHIEEYVKTYVLVKD